MSIKQVTNRVLGILNEKVATDSEGDEIEAEEQAKKTNLNFSGFAENGTTFHVNMMTGQMWFDKKKFAYDKIIDLPSAEYTQVVNEMTRFLSAEVRTKFLEKGYIYKRSALLHGKPGTGKTMIVNRVAREIVKQGGICLWITDPNMLGLAYSILDDVQPNTLVGVIFEEFDDMARKYESTLLTLLDGQVQKHNVIYLATTNYLEKVPARLYRPGRMSSVIEVHAPTAEARRMYLEIQMGKGAEGLEERVEMTAGLSIDELKELYQSVDLLGNPINSVLLRLRAGKGLPELNYAVHPEGRQDRRLPVPSSALRSLFGEEEDKDWEVKKK
jgi:hypothetical protein